MLVKLLPEQVMNFWDLIKDSIENSLPPYVTSNPQRMARIQEHLFGGILQCWVPAILGEAPRVLGFVITKVVYDDSTDSANLLIFSMYAVEKWDISVWNEGFQTLKKFAKSRGCESIIGYTNEEGAIRFAERFGGEAEYTFLKIPLYDQNLSIGE